MADPANTVLQSAQSRQQAVYDHAESVAQTFISNQGTMYPAAEARQMVESNQGVGAGLAARIIAHLVEDVVDPLTAVRTNDGVYVGVIDYTERDFYYETTEYHDVLGESTRAVCAPCVDEATFDHQAVSFPAFHQYNKQSRSQVAREGVGSIPRGATAQERRDVIGRHFLGAHSSLTPLEIAEGVTGASAAEIAEAAGRDPDESRDALNQALSIEGVMDQQGISFDQAKQTFDLGIDQITVGATLVSGTTIGGNTAIHGGNQSSFNVEDFATTSSTSGEVPTSQGDGTLAMQAQTDTRTDLEDSAGTVVADAEGMAFTASADAAVSVTDDTDGTGTVDVSATDTQTGVSDDGTQVLGSVTDINFSSGTNTTATVSDDGDGTATVSYDASGTSGGRWTEDANSPLTISSTDTGTITLASNYPLIQVVCTDDPSSTTGTTVQLRVNGVTSSYETTLTNGNPFTEGFVRQVWWSGSGTGARATFAGQFDTDWGGGNEAPTLQSTYGHTADSFGNPSVTSPIDSITLFNNAANNFSATARVYGWSP